jgi:hypothetical protein
MVCESRAFGWAGRGMLVALVSATVPSLPVAAVAQAAPAAPAASAVPQRPHADTAMVDADMASAGTSMAGPLMETAHMRMTVLRPPARGDSAAEAGVLAALRASLAPYADYHRALADGFRIFAPQVPQHVYHFTSWRRSILAGIRFDASRPTSLLYEKTGDSSYRLVGAMYTAPRGTSLSDLDGRVPLSAAQWHVHTNWCVPRRGEMARFAERARDGRPQFGGQGTITTESACAAAGGRFYPQIFGWMVHVYPFATDPAVIWGRDAMHDMEHGHGAS